MRRSPLRKAVWALGLGCALLLSVPSYADSPIENQRKSELGPDYRTGPGRFAFYFLGFDLGILFELHVAASKHFTIGLGAGIPTASTSLTNYGISFNYFSFEPYAGFYFSLRFHLFDGSDTAGTATIPAIWNAATTTLNDTITISALIGWSWHATRAPYSCIIAAGPLLVPAQNNVSTTDFGVAVRISWAVDFWLDDVFN